MDYVDATKTSGDSTAAKSAVLTIAQEMGNALKENASATQDTQGLTVLQENAY